MRKVFAVQRGRKWKREKPIELRDAREIAVSEHARRTEDFARGRESSTVLGYGPRCTTNYSRSSTILKAAFVTKTCSDVCARQRKRGNKARKFGRQSNVRSPHACSPAARSLSALIGQPRHHQIAIQLLVCLGERYSRRRGRVLQRTRASGRYYFITQWFLHKTYQPSLAAGRGGAQEHCMQEVEYPFGVSPRSIHRPDAQ